VIVPILSKLIRLWNVGLNGRIEPTLVQGNAEVKRVLRSEYKGIVMLL
jgi:hypothetical protein